MPDSSRSGEQGSPAAACHRRRGASQTPGDRRHFDLGGLEPGRRRARIPALPPTRWKTDPVVTRRMSRDATGDVSWHPDGDWPHLRSVAHGGLLIDRFPIEDVPSVHGGPHPGLRSRCPG